MDRPLNRHLADTVIYEMHVRGFTRHPPPGSPTPAATAGSSRRSPTCRELGVTAVELLPVTEFDEADNYRNEPVHRQRRCTISGATTP